MCNEGRRHLDNESMRDTLARERAEKPRCESSTGGGRYHCCLATGHTGSHRASGTYTSWTDATTTPDVTIDAY